MVSIGTPYFYQATCQGMPSGSLLLDKQTIATSVPIVASIPFGEAEVGDELFLMYGGAPLGDPTPINNVEMMVYDILIDADAWPTGEADVIVTVKRGMQTMATSASVHLKVIDEPVEISPQCYDGLLLGTYGTGIVDSWIVASAYRLDVPASPRFAAVATGTNTDKTSLLLKRLGTTRANDQALGQFTFTSDAWAYVSTQATNLTRGDQLGLFLEGSTNSQLAFEYSI